MAVQVEARPTVTQKGHSQYGKSQIETRQQTQKAKAAAGEGGDAALEQGVEGPAELAQLLSDSALTGAVAPVPVP